MEAFQLAEQQVAEDLGNGIKRRLYGYDEQVMLVKVEFETGATGTVHQHEQVQVTYVERGMFDFTIDGKTQRLKQGDGCYVRSNALHGCVCVEAGTLLDVFSPYRPDFLGSAHPEKE